MEKRWNIKNCNIEISTIGNGITQYTCISKEFFVPFGFAWTVESGTQNNKKLAHLQYIYTLEFARRHGIAKLLLNKIFEINDIILTTSGSKDGGKALLTTCGFQFEPQTLQWFKKKI